MRIKVKKITDGDTFQSTRGGFFRLAHVNAPEKREVGYRKAKAILANFIEGEELIVKKFGTSYGRKVVVARVPGEKITTNEKMRYEGCK
jgi:endonuclease YncB( thermonuclease family)